MASALPPHGPSLAVQRRERAAGLADDHVERGHVVDLELGLGGDVDGALGHQHVGPEVAVRAGAPAPALSERKSSSLAALLPAAQRGVGQRGVLEPATSETWHRVALSSDLPVHAPSPFEAHQRRCSAGAETTPTTTSSSTASAISVAHTGTPRTKFLVPSIGSTIQRRWLWPVEPCSSPMTASREPARDRVRRMLSSTAWSASVTGVRSGLVITCRSSALNRDVGEGVGVVGEHVGQAQVVGVVAGMATAAHPMLR